MFTIIRAMAELESSLISERINPRGEKLDSPQTPNHVKIEIQYLANITDLSINNIRAKLIIKLVELLLGRL